MKIYIASRLENHPQVKAVRDALVADGHSITYDWTRHGSVQGEGEDRLREVAAAERAGVMTADIVIVLLPGGRGTHAELGIANALGIPVILVSKTRDMFQADSATCAFYWNDNVRQLWTEGHEPEAVLPEWIRRHDDVLANLPSGAHMISRERARHASLGWTQEHDAEHQSEELAWAACYYALPEDIEIDESDGGNGLGYVFRLSLDAYYFFNRTNWHWQYAKRDNKNRIQQLTVAGALIAAEIDRVIALQVEG